MTSRKAKRPAGSVIRSVIVPERKISETILEFGEPLLKLRDDDRSVEEWNAALKFVILVWNVHVMATPVWEAPEHLAALIRTVHGASAPPELADLFEVLTRRRYERFADDPRVVGEWEIVADGAGGHRLRCDARLPHGLEARSR